MISRRRIRRCDKPAAHFVLTTVFWALLADSALASHSSPYLEYRRLTVAQLGDLKPEVSGVDRARLLLIQAQKQVQVAFSDAGAALQEAQALFDPVEHRNEAMLHAAMLCQLEFRQGRIAASAAPCSAMEAGSANDPVVQALSWWTRSYLHLRQGRLSDALVAGRRCADIASTIGDADLLAIAHNAQGVALMESGLPDSALEHYELAFQSSAGWTDPDFLRALNFNISVGQMEAGHYDEALAGFREALIWIEETGNRSRELIARTMIARALRGKGEPEHAIEYLEAPLETLARQVDPDSYLGATAALADSLLAIGRTDSALALLARGLSIAEANDNFARTKQLRLRYGDALIASGQADRAIPILRAQITRLDRTRPTQELPDTLDSMASGLAQLGNYEQAYATQQEAVAARNSLLTDSFNRRLSVLKTALGLDLKTQELATAREHAQALRFQAQRDVAVRNGVIIASVLALLLTLSVSSWRFQKRLSRQHLRTASRLKALLRKRRRKVKDEMGARMQVEQETRKLEESLAEGEQLRSLGRLTSGVAHDFNNLMNVVLLSADYLKSDTLTPEQKKCVQDIEASADACVDITSALLAYSRKQPLQPETIHLRDYVRDTRSIFESTVGDEIQLEIDIEPCAVMADRAQLTTAIINLLLNARDASLPGGGVVRLTASPQPDRTAAGIRIADTGHGMTADESARAIDPFFTTKEPGQGYGLGLSIVYGFARQSGGDLRIHSVPGAGTTVTLVLPLATITDAQTDSPVTENLVLPPGLRVLLVEDQRAVRQTIRRTLEKLGCTVDEAETGGAAERMLAEGWSGELLISDVLMPGGRSGHNVADYVRQHAPQLPVLLISGYTEAVVSDIPLLHKPFTTEQLVDAIFWLVTDTKIS